jgi:hypothetical protein
MTFDDSWYGMRRHRGERGSWAPGIGWYNVPAPAEYVPAKVAVPVVLPPEPALVQPPEVAVNPQAAEKGLADASNPPRPERPHVESMERAAGPASAAVESGEPVFKPGPNWSKRGVAQGFLRWILAHGEVAATEIFRRGREAGISAKALRKAQKVCGIRPVQRRRAWWWSMPPPRRGQMTCNKT